MLQQSGGDTLMSAETVHAAYLIKVIADVPSPKSQGWVSKSILRS
jgi:hypothetical protein